MPDTAPASHAGNSCTDKITHPFYRLNLLPIPSYHSPCKGARPLCYFLGEKVTKALSHRSTVGAAVGKCFAPLKGRVSGAACLDAYAPLAGLLRRGAAPAACGRLPVSTTNLDFIYSASLVIHPKNGKHESHHKRHDALESIREYSIFRHPHNTSQT